MITIFKILNEAQLILSFVTFALLIFQVIYMLLGVLPGKKFPEAKKNHKYGVIIAARNEARVIAQLIDSIKKQDYPSDLVDVFVVADNCTDNTATVARRAGAIVYERFNNEKRGKSYALDFLLNKIFEDKPDDYKGFLFFDADNLLTKNYIHEMNKAVDSGLRIITSYRNSKNFGKNWITAGYGLSFLRDCRFVHRSRQRLNSSTFVAGTGFYAEAEIFRREQGWKYNLMTEDMEFSIIQAMKNEKIGYVEDAEFYDEQPETYIQSYHQRMRWIRGAYMTFLKYGFRLTKGIFSKNGYAKLDLMLYLTPVPCFWEVVLFSNLLLHLGYGLCTLGTGTATLLTALGAIVSFVVWTYSIAFIVLSWITLLEWKRIKLRPMQKILYMFLSPLFAMTYSPIIILALFHKVSWKPVRRNCTVDITELETKLAQSQEKQTPVVSAMKAQIDSLYREATSKVAQAPALVEEHFHGDHAWMPPGNR